MIKKTLFFYFLMHVCHCSMAQSQSLKDFEKSIESLPEEQVFQKFDDRIIELTKSNAPDSSFYNTLNLECEYAQKVNNRQYIEYSALKLIEYPEYFEKKKLYSYLKWVGEVQCKKGNQDAGIKLLLQAKEVAEELSNDTLMTQVNKAIGIQFSTWKNFDLAKKYLFESLQISEHMKYARGIAGVCMTIGNVFKNTDVYDSARFYYDKSIEYSKLCNFTRGIAGNYNNLGNLYLRQELYDQAIDYYLDAIPINDNEKNAGYLATNYDNLGRAYAELGENDKALYYIEKAITINESKEDSIKLASNFHRRSQIYAGKKRFKKAFNDLKLSKDINNRYVNNAKLALAADIEASFNQEKKEAKIKQLQAKQSSQAILIAAREEELVLEQAIQKENELILWGVGLIVLALLLAVFAFWRNGRQRKKYTDELSVKNNQIQLVNSSLGEAKEVLTVKNEEILDSISYAKRIQAAILPSENHLRDALEDAFVLYLPKDIVAGDFYWTETVGDTVLFAVADCTGHGVPGAMVSVICNNALNEIIKLKSISDPGLILDLTTDHILKQFEKSEEDVKDGMDIGLCSYNAVTHEFLYAGANIPLWIVREGKVIEIKATRQPVGKHVLRQKFTTNHIEILDGDIIYMSSDGFADQFGGQRNKKYMKKNFKKLILEISEKPLDEQNNIIKSTFSEWKSNNEQVDDICVMGVKFKAS